jgi:hypothetical protein
MSFSSEDCETAASRQRRKHENRIIYIVGNRYLATPSEDRFRATTMEDYKRLRQRVL